MFTPETEDMLPRAAPKPCAQNLDEPKAQPVVPEVSILFGQQERIEPITNALPQKPKPQTYAAWKKQVLPRVTFPPEGSEVTGTISPQSTSSCSSYTTHTDSNPQRSNIYPLRIAATANYQQQNMEYRRSLESATSYSPPIHELAANANSAYQNLQLQQRRSLETIPQIHTGTTRVQQDVLTICAGTQTDFVGTANVKEVIPEAFLRNFASKQDIDSLLSTMQQMREEQQQLRNIIEVFLMQQQPERVCYKDVATQCDSTLNNLPQYARDENCNENAPVNNFHTEVQRAPQFQSPAAQSTGYRPCMQQFYQQQQHQQQQQQQNIANNVLPKPSTEKSVVMNELALKYLSNEKLNELMQDMQIATTPLPTEPVTPLRHIENLGQNDISNASYKYLKKYRLLPEENEQKIGTQQQQHRQQSPYNRVASPLTVPRTQEQILDFEHIRNQPKFL